MVGRGDMANTGNVVGRWCTPFNHEVLIKHNFVVTVVSGGGYVN